MGDSSKVTQQMTRAQVFWSQDMFLCINLTVCSQKKKEQGRRRRKRRQSRREGRGKTSWRAVAKPFTLVVGSMKLPP